MSGKIRGLLFGFAALTGLAGAEELDFYFQIDAGINITNNSGSSNRAVNILFVPTSVGVDSAARTACVAC